MVQEKLLNGLHAGSECSWVADDEQQACLQVTGVGWMRRCGWVGRLRQEGDHGKHGKVNRETEL